MPRTIHLAGQSFAALREALAQLGLTGDAEAASAPLAAVGAGVSLAPTDLVFHCDLVRVRGGIMIEAPAVVGDAAERIGRLRSIASRLTLELVPLAGPAALLVYREGWPFDLVTHDPQSLLGEPIAGRTPRGAGDEVMRDFIESGAALAGDGVIPWVWGGGRLPRLPRVDPPGVLAGGGREVAGLAKLVGWAHEPGLRG